MPDVTIVLDQTDLDGLIQKLAEGLRRDAFALEGYQTIHHLGSSRDPALEGIRESLDRSARLLTALGERLCKGCRVVGAVETLRLEPRNPSRSS